MRRVAVTGLGCICSQGRDVDEFSQALSSGTSGIGALTIVPTERTVCKVAAEVHGYDPDDWLMPQESQRLDRFAQFAVIAGREAMRAAGFVPSREQGLRSAVVMGSGIGGLSTLDIGFQRLYVEGHNKVYPLSVPKVMLNAGVSALSMQFGILGPCYAVSSACSSANHAISLAFAMVRSGQADLALTGGSEACLTFGMVKAWEALRVLAPDTCRPFSKGRQGIVLGEGAGALILEPLDLALARGATIHAELVGCGLSSDASDLTLPDPDGAARAMQAALLDAGLAPEQVNYINAHGTGTPANDASETRAIRAVFGAHAGRLAVSSTKSMHGHALGAAGALEAVATIQALKTQIAPPTINYLEPDPDCDLDYVANQARPMPIEVALSNSFAFGGLNAVVAFRRYP
ncbi:beta-ACP synthase [Thiocystis minor]|uniref:beta-ketoacyl-[acyl-carrier-protein] synthase family protein n=1 Tax=Thiocystis minor TaxID=61597 RepID=UPI001911C1DE|nr:beta-ketoacyl-[acyl-carrier-protein] synthase family protein [Thiocystis minor]MBK5962811.1 beta-ACP synthase [Thiocystis minor]